MQNTNKLFQYILEQTKASNISEQTAYTILNHLKSVHSPESQDIAVIGVACTFAGADNAAEYWENLLQGKNCVGPFPVQRQALLDNADTLSSASGGYLNHIDLFDESFFRISPKEALLMDPAQRLVLEKAYEALEDAGYSWETLDGSSTGVYIGMDSTFSSQYYQQIDNEDILALTGAVTGIISGRISYIFNLKGPNMVIDTACSSGLVAVHTACKAILNHECDMAVAGGVQISLLPEGSLDRNDIEAADGILRAFDKKAAGTVWGEGAGVVILKLLDKALQDKDPIYAVIKGSAVNSDGVSNGLTAPNVEAQTTVITAAWNDAGIDPETIAYIEAHGTGTLLGDPIEIKGITNAFRKFTNKSQFCGIGSVKSNIGHTAGASGIASLIKSVLSMKHGMIPASLHFDEPNPHFDLSKSVVYINDRPRKWSVEGSPRRSGISSFGFGGTNCHLVLEEAPIVLKDPPDTNKLWLFTLSAKNKNSLMNLVEKNRDFICNKPDLNLTDFCFTSSVGRGHYEHRMIVIFYNLEDLKTKLSRIYSAGLSDLSEDVYYMNHEVIQGNDRVQSSGYISEAEQIRISRQANQIISGLEMEDGNHKELMRELCSLYTRGATVKWKELYGKYDCRKLNLPTYSFERKSYWVTRDKLADANSKEETKPSLHPLLDECQELSEDLMVFITKVSAEKHWILADHKVLGKHTIPGTAYLEMISSIAGMLSGSKRFELKDVVFYTPLMLEEGESKTIHTKIINNDGIYEFTIASKIQSSQYFDKGKWITYAAGKFLLDAGDPAPSMDIHAIRARCKEERVESQTGSVHGNFTFGPRWWNEVHMNAGDRELLANIKLHEDFSTDTLLYRLHPSLMDIAVNIMSPNTEHNLYLPLSYKRIHIYGRIPSEICCYLKEIDGKSETKELVSYDITITDPSGNVIVRIDEYTVKQMIQLDVGRKDAGDFFNEMKWSKTDSGIYQMALSGKRVLFFKGEDQRSKDLDRLLRSKGAEIIEVVIGQTYVKWSGLKYTISAFQEDYYRLFEDIKESEPDYILHTLADHTNGEHKDFEQLRGELQLGIYSLFHIAKALNNRKLKDMVKVVVVTHYANFTGSVSSPVYPQHAALFNMGKVVSLENQKIKCISVDMDHTTPSEFVLSEMMDDKVEAVEVAYRKGIRYEREIIRAAMKRNQTGGENTRGIIKQEGVYIITGGTGGIGLHLARELSMSKQVRLILISRTGMVHEESAHILGTIRASGSTVEICKADVTDYDGMKAAINRIRQQYGQINGVIHSAGVAASGIILTKRLESFDQVIAPKIYGTWILDQLTEKDHLDFFIMCSSVASFLADEGQVDYTAANAYLDMYAVSKSSEGKNFISINWPAWNEVGMAVNHGKNRDNDYFMPIGINQALFAFRTILQSGAAHVIVGRRNPNDMKAEMRQELQAESNTGDFGGRNTNKISLTGSETAQYTRWEIAIGEVWSDIMGLDDINIHHSFYRYGGNSIQAIQIHRALDRLFPNMVDITDIFNYQTIRGMAKCLQRASEPEVPEETEVTEEADELDKLLDSIEKGKLTIDRLS